MVSVSKKHGLLLCAILLLFFSACGGEKEDLSSAVAAGSGFSQGGMPVSASSRSPEIVPQSDKDPEQSSAVSEPPGAEEIPAQVQIPTSLYQEPAPDTPLLYVTSGKSLTVSATDDPLWYSALMEDGTSGYLYGECLFRVDGDGNISGASLFAESAADAIASLQEQFPEGMYWNHMDREDIAYGEETPYSVTDIPCDNWENGELYCNFYNGKTAELFPSDTLCQCLGFASFLSDQLFGTEAPLHMFYDSSLLRVGDHIRLDEWEHSVTVTSISQEGITVGEVNENYTDCMISWSRQLSWEELDELAWDSTYISRYPFFPDEEGGFSHWEDD